MLVHLQYLPAYRPELNPVELLWSQLRWNIKNKRGCPCSVLDYSRLN
ncbi:transposase [Telluribacter humicola]